MPPQQSRRWVFTLNNYTDNEVASLLSLDSTYLVFGREVGESGTPHLQGFVVFHTNQRFAAAKALLGERVHLERAMGTSVQAATYCKKDGDFEERGELPANQGKRNDFAELKEWVLEQPVKPTAALVADRFPGLFIKYGRLMEWIDLIFPPPTLVDGTPRVWQQQLLDSFEEEADDRKVTFVVDSIGGSGKSWFCRYMVSKFGELTQVLSIGRREDLAYVVNDAKSIFLFDIPRQSLEYLQYAILEQLKDGIIFSTKYQGRVKYLSKKAHVVVLTNEEPDYNRLSHDRWNVIRPSAP